MRFSIGMVRRGLVAVGIIAVVFGLMAVTAKSFTDEIGRAVAFGLKPKTFYLHDVNRTAKGDKLPVRDVYKVREIFYPNCSTLSGPACKRPARA